MDTTAGAHRSAHTRVLIVGAGPVGLALAAELVRRGTRVRVVDRATEASAQSRAILVWPRTLELLRGCGATEEFLERGHRLREVGYYSNGAGLGTARLHELRDTPYPFVLTLPQQQTELVLADRLTHFGGTVQRGVELLALTQDAARVRCVLRHPDGRTEEAEADWVVGADGAHSAVRKAAAVPFDGAAVDATFAITDGRIDGPVRRDRLHYFYSLGGALGVVPLPGGLFRVAAGVAHRDPDAPPPRPELFDALLRERAPGAGRFVHAEWTASFRVHSRIAARFRAGRVLLAGDAAHITSPAGGQGMNTGLHDAANLGWRLAAVAGGGPEELLDGYDRERRHAAHQVADDTARLTGWGLTQGRLRTAVRDTAIRAAHHTGLFHRTVTPMLSQTTLGYRAVLDNGAPAARLRPGDRVPLFTAGTGATDPGLDPERFTLLVWTGRQNRPTDALRGTLDRAADRAAVLVATPATTPERLRRLLPATPAVLLVRPDGHLDSSAAWTTAHTLPDRIPATARPGRGPLRVG